MVSFQDAPDKNNEHDKKMELRSRLLLTLSTLQIFTK